MRLRDAQDANRAVAGALMAGLAASMIIITALVRTTVFIVRAGVRASRKGPSK